MSGSDRRQIDGIEVVPCRLNGPRGIVKAFIIHDEASVVVVDTGYSDEDGERLVKVMAERTSPAASSFTIVLTHGHGDHTGGLAPLLKARQWEVVCHADEEPTLVAAGIRPSRVVGDGERWEACGGLRFLHMPGHSPGSMAVFHQPSGTLLAGDAIVSAGQHLMVSPPFLSDDPEEARRSVERLLAAGLSIESVLVAHGEDVYAAAAVPLARILSPVRTYAPPAPDR